MTEFIVHADDFGKSAAVNEAIDECFRNQWISETSLMVNMPSCMDAVIKARKNGYEQFVGLHLNLTEGRPLTSEIREIPIFCSQDGFFNKKFQRLARSRFFISHEERAAVRKELYAQMSRFLDIGGLARRIDSHHHIHTYWPFFRVVSPIALTLGFTSMRISADMHNVRWDRRLYKFFLNNRIRKTFETRTHFDGVNTRVLNDPGGVVEVMVHPLWNGNVLCDTNIPFSQQVLKLRNAPNSKICQVCQ